MRVIQIRDSETSPRGERRVARFLSEISLEGTAFWGYPYWQFDSHNQRRVRREIDFLVIIPDRGILVIEVKDGVVQISIPKPDTRSKAKWTSTDHQGNQHAIKAPDDQAEDGKWSLIPYLKKCGCSSIPAGIGVCLPDTEVLTASWIPADILALRDDVATAEQFEKFLFRCFHYCLPTKNWPDISYKLVCESLLPTTAEKTAFRVALESTSRQVDDASTSVVSLVQDQIDALSDLYGRSRAVITGGAGTGKTLIAQRLVKSLAANDLRVLLLVPTKHLMMELSKSLEKQGLPVFVENRSVLRKAGNRFNIEEQIVVADPPTLKRLLYQLESKSPEEAEPNFRELKMGGRKLPVSLQGSIRRHAAEIASLPSRGIFDAVVVDETQDVPSFLIGQVMRFMNDFHQSPAYFFVDFNQMRARWIDSSEELPVPWQGLISKDSPVISLGTNCRNPRSIGNELARLKGPIRFHPLSPEGPDIRWVEYESFPDVVELKAVVKNMLQDLTRDGVQREERIVLHAPRSFRGKGLAYTKYRKSLKSLLGGARLFAIDDVKGLEAPVVVVIIGPDDSVDDALLSQIYVAFSRATSFLAVCCSRRFRTQIQQYLETQTD